MSAEKRIIDTLLKERNLEDKLLAPEEFTSKLHNFDVIISYKLPPFLNKYLFSGAISWATHSAATHAGIYFDGDIVHARIKNRGLVREKIFDRKDELLFVLRPESLSEEQRSQLEKNMHVCLNAKEKIRFDYAGALGYLFYRKFGLTKNYLNIKQREFCTEFVDRTFRDVGFLLTDKPDASLVAGKDILESPKLTFLYYIDGVRDGQSYLPTKESRGYLVQQLRTMVTKTFIE